VDLALSGGHLSGEGVGGLELEPVPLGESAVRFPAGGWVGGMGVILCGCGRHDGSSYRERLVL
jgi:hypothetical protein